MEAFFNVFRYGPIYGEIRVWNCLAHVYLFSEELEEKGEVVRVKSPRGFTFQILREQWEYLNELEREELLKSLENWVYWVLEDNGGAINWSGIYYIYEVHAEKYVEIINRHVLRAWNKRTDVSLSCLL